MDKQVNLLVELRSRRTNNYRNQLRSVLLEGLEIFGADITESVIDECRKIYSEYKALTDEQAY